MAYVVAIQVTAPMSDEVPPSAQSQQPVMLLFLANSMTAKRCAVRAWLVNCGLLDAALQSCLQVLIGQFVVRFHLTGHKQLVAATRWLRNDAACRIDQHINTIRQFTVYGSSCPWICYETCFCAYSCLYFCFYYASFYCADLLYLACYFLSYYYANLVT